MWGRGGRCNGEIYGKCTDSKFHPKGGQRMAADPQGTPHPDTLQDTSTSVQGMKGPPATVDHPQEGEGPTQARRLVRITRRWFEGRAPGPRQRHPEGETQRGGRGGGAREYVLAHPHRVYKGVDIYGVWGMHSEVCVRKISSAAM